jgi:sec-independent protein translocase protein TatA
MFSQIGPMEVVLVLVIALIILGPKKLPEAGRSIGKGMREFKDSISGVTKDDDDERELTAVRSERERDRDVA